MGPMGPAGGVGPQGPAGNDGQGVTVTQLAAGNANCPTGGAKVTSTAGTAYVCNPSGGGSGDFSVTFTQTGSSLDGTLSISVACLDGAKVTGKVNGDSIDFGSVQGQCSVDYKGKISGDQMSGTYDVGGGVGGTWKASKA